MDFKKRKIRSDNGLRTNWQTGLVHAVNTHVSPKKHQEQRVEEKIDDVIVNARGDL